MKAVVQEFMEVLMSYKWDVIRKKSRKNNLRYVIDISQKKGRLQK